MYVCTDVHMYVGTRVMYGMVWSGMVCMYVCMHVCMYVCDVSEIYIYIHIHRYRHVQQICMYKLWHARTHMYITK